MAGSPNVDPDFGTREEDWPELDIDSDTEEYAEANERAETAMLATINRSIRQRHTQPAHDGTPQGLSAKAQSHHSQLTEGGIEANKRTAAVSIAPIDRPTRQRNWQSTRNTIPQALYVKAWLHQDQLTEEERRVLFSRGDLVGKALAYPDSLTPDETHQILLMRPPEVVHANILRATAGTLSTPRELYAKAKDALDRCQFQTTLNDQEIDLIARDFYTMDDPGFSYGARMMALSMPGTGQAMRLLSDRLGFDVPVFQAASICQTHRGHPMPAKFTALVPPQDPPEQEQQPVDTTPIISAIRSLHEQLHQGTITEAEAVARNAEYQAALRAARPQLSSHFHHPGTIPPPTRPGFPPPQPTPPDMFWPPIPNPPSREDNFGAGPWPPAGPTSSPIRLFMTDKNVGGWDVERGWCALAEHQRAAYRAQSEALRLAAWAEHEAAMAAGTLSVLCIPVGKNDDGPADDARQRRAGEPRAEYLARLASAGDRRYPLGDAREEYFGRRRMPGIITGLKIFHDELGAGVGFWDAEGRYRSLTEEEKEVYEERASATNDAARAAYDEGRTL